jgi:hypothetical protein
MAEVKNESLLLLGIDKRFITHRALSLIPGINMSLKIELRLRNFLNIRLSKSWIIKFFIEHKCCFPFGQNVVGNERDLSSSQ